MSLDHAIRSRPIDEPLPLLLPIGLPTLKVAWLQVPYPMTEAEYNQIVTVLGYCRDALIERPTISQALADSEGERK